MYARNLQRQRLGKPHVKLGSFPMEWAHYMQWNLGSVKPAEWWELDAYDWHLAGEVQAAWRNGIEDANLEKKQAADDQERIERLKAKLTG